ncbi:MAG: 50S ribosomal protein L2 [Candidatus Thorarchaeota archaeon]|nr:50S ribosomal protein L2 [Candidatus Thorarchaeota archaeon]
MGRRVLVQRKGSGTSQWQSPSHRKIAPVKHPKWAPDKTYEGEVVGLHHESGRGAPLAEIRYKGESKSHFMVAPEGLQVGQTVQCGPNATLQNGNTLMLEYIPEGTPIYNIEGSPGDGGKYVRSSGLVATIISIDKSKALVRLPSGKQKLFSPRCRATIGIIAGGGRPEKPLLKAGAAYHHAHARVTKWPVVRGTAMNAVSHPHGGHSHHLSTVSRHASPGRKVGHIAARRTGRKSK